MENKEEPRIVTKKHMARMEREAIQRRYLLIGAAVVIVLVIGVIVYGILDQTVLRAQRAVAWVGNEKITTEKFENRVKYLRFQLVQQYTSYAQLAQMFGGGDPTQNPFASSLQSIQSQLSDPQIVGRSALDQLIDEAVINQEAAKLGITVSDQEVNDALQAAFRYFPNGTPVPTTEPTMMPTSTLSAQQLAMIPPTATPTEPPAVTPEAAATEAAATPTVAAAVTETPAVSETPVPTATPYTEEGFKTQVAKYLESVKNINFTDADLHAIFRNQILTDKLQKQLKLDPGATEEQVWARHILVDDEATAQALLVRIKNGEDWSKLAAEFSKDTSNKDKGGDLGWFGKGRMVPEFETAAFALKIGETSQPVKTQFGYHLIQVLGHENRPLTPDEQAQAKNAAFSQWLTKVKTDLKVTEEDTWKTVIPTEPALPVQ
jgi:peptidyl-prolyl cis-trans isomerase D